MRSTRKPEVAKMVLKKIVRLRNIGRFRSLAAHGEVDFRRVTLVYGTNGQGKTTLAGVLRSLTTGNRAYIDERATLGVSGNPEAEILLGGSLATFADGVWSTTVGGLEIFDSTFVNENVFTGEHVGPEHRKNLYEVVVGEAAVALVREIDNLDAESRQESNRASEAESELRKLVQAPFSISEFVDLQPESDLAEKIRDCTTRLNAVRKQREILARPELELLSAPEFPRGTLAVLGKSVSQLSADVEARVRSQLQRLDHRGEAWVRQGLQYVKPDNLCPFCGQDTSTIDLLRTYSEFFSNAYRDHLIEIERASNLVSQLLGEQVLQTFQRRVLENEARIRGWADLADLESASLPSERWERAWIHLRTLVVERLQRKTANPSDALTMDEQFSAALQDFAEAMAAINEHNNTVREANSKISELKQQAAATKPEQLEGELRRLRNMQIRQTPEADALVQRLLAARSRKKELDDAKQAKKDDLEAAATGVLATYQESINRLLRDFGANFTIVNTRPSYAGGKASSTYQLELNNTKLDIGDASTPRGTRCFRTALSTGDKSTLALAFFLARLQQEDLSARCVLIDDPLTSLDAFRTACTQQEIASLATRAAQVVVLSHDAFFLKGILDSSDRTTTRCLQVVRDGEGHILRAWDVAEYFLREAHEEYLLMKSYLAEGPPAHGDLTSIARAIRPYVEGHLRNRFPDEFPPNEWLGDFIPKVKQAAQGTPLASIVPKVPEMEAINDYSKRFHHTQATGAPRPTDAELQPWVRRAIAFVQAA